MKVSNTQERLKEIMKMQNLRQTDVVALCAPFSSSFGTKVTHSDISYYLKGRNEPAARKLSILARALHTTEAYLMGLDVGPDVINQEDIVPIQPPAMQVPIIGKVAAGVPIYATQNISGYVAVDNRMANTNQDELFALKIKGNSMQPYINNGDIVICRRQSEVNNNEIAIVLVGSEEATCKRVHVQENGVMLISVNPEYEPMFFTPEAIRNEPVEIIAKVLEVRRKIN